MLESLEDQLFRRLLPNSLRASTRASAPPGFPPPRRHRGVRAATHTVAASEPYLDRLKLPRYLDDAPGAGASRTFSWEPSSYALHADQGSGTDLPWPRASPSASPLRLRVSMERPPLQACERVDVAFSLAFTPVCHDLH